ncbi:MAG: hypothetical protein HUU50_04890 [Candidatus Brocadiae bacterium]|nr:hypothetical protein [Candidatus Brocadiia bacterium]
MERQCMGFFYLTWQALRQGNVFWLFFCSTLVLAETRVEIRLLLWNPQVSVMREREKLSLSSKEAVFLRPGDKITTGKNGYAVLGYIIREETQVLYFSKVLKEKETYQIEHHFMTSSKGSMPKPLSHEKYNEWEEYSRQYRFISFAGIEPGIEMRSKYESFYCLSPQGNIAKKKPVFYAMGALEEYRFSLELVDILEGKSFSLVLLKEEQGQMGEEKVSIHSFVLPERKTLEYDRSYLVRFYVHQKNDRENSLCFRFTTLPESLAKLFLKERDILISKTQNQEEWFAHSQKWQQEWEEEIYDASGESQMMLHELWIELLKKKIPE